MGCYCLIVLCVAQCMHDVCVCEREKLYDFSEKDFYFGLAL